MVCPRLLSRSITNSRRVFDDDDIDTVTHDRGSTEGRGSCGTLRSARAAQAGTEEHIHSIRRHALSSSARPCTLPRRSHPDTALSRALTCSHPWCAHSCVPPVTFPLPALTPLYVPPSNPAQSWRTTKRMATLINAHDGDAASEDDGDTASEDAGDVASEDAGDAPNEDDEDGERLHVAFIIWAGLAAHICAHLSMPAQTAFSLGLILSSFFQSPSTPDNSHSSDLPYARIVGASSRSVISPASLHHHRPCPSPRPLHPLPHLAFHIGGAPPFESQSTDAEPDVLVAHGRAARASAPRAGMHHSPSQSDSSCSSVESTSSHGNGRVTRYSYSTSGSNNSSVSFSSSFFSSTHLPTPYSSLRSSSVPASFLSSHTCSYRRPTDTALLIGTRPTHPTTPPPRPPPRGRTKDVTVGQHQGVDERRGVGVHAAHGAEPVSDGAAEGWDDTTLVVFAIRETSALVLSEGYARKVWALRPAIVGAAGAIFCGGEPRESGRFFLDFSPARPLDAVLRAKRYEFPCIPLPPFVLASLLPVSSPSCYSSPTILISSQNRPHTDFRAALPTHLANHACPTCVTLAMVPRHPRRTFGPSAAAGASRTLIDVYPFCGLSVSVATDGTLHQTEVYAASRSAAAPSNALGYSSSRPSFSGHSQTSSGHSSGGRSGKKCDRKGKDGKGWGDRPVLLMLDIRLGLDGGNPVYHAIKVRLIRLFNSFCTVPSTLSSSCPFFIALPRSSSAAIRPSSPYIRYSILFVPPALRRPLTLQSVGIAGARPSSSYYFVGAQGGGLFYLDPHHLRPAVQPFVPSPHSHAPRQHPHAHAAQFQFQTHAAPGPETYTRGESISPEPELVGRAGSLSPEYGYPHEHAPGRGQTPITEDELLWGTLTSSTRPPGGALTPAEEAHFTCAYVAAELHTFHCERMRKMPLMGKGASAPAAYGDDDDCVDAGGAIEIEDDWVAPVAPPRAPRVKKSSFTGKAKSKTHSKKAVPVPSVHYRFPASVEDGAALTSPPQPQPERERERQWNLTVSPRSGGGSGQRSRAGWRTDRRRVAPT
ncbi:hypothetical protein DFH09DRAFT_1367989 [Mycena vulgaris]|nr:hypothetical protein DFH09DRAFT_1367989 [Mycena vulgaris]